MTYRFKIKLQGIQKPPVWRRIVIQGDATFLDLHEAIQGAFGWEDAHLFKFSERPYGGSMNIGIPDDDFLMVQKRLDARTVTLQEVFGAECKKLTYVYDFGDDWIHEISLEETSDEKIDGARCMAGKGACPPEDCGGRMGYEGIKELFLTRPNGKEAREYRKWLGLASRETWDANYFNLAEANERMEMFRERES